MVDGCGGPGLIPRLFLVATDNVDVAHLVGCRKAACAAGVVHHITAIKILTRLQSDINTGRLETGNPMQ